MKKNGLCLLLKHCAWLARDCVYLPRNARTASCAALTAKMSISEAGKSASRVTPGLMHARFRPSGS